MLDFIKKLFGEFKVAEEDIRLAEADFRAKVTNVDEYITHAFSAGAHWALSFQSGEKPAETAAPVTDVPATVTAEPVADPAPDATPPAASAEPASSEPQA